MFIDFLQQYPFILAFILGLIPALVWLWFWLKEDIHHEPAKMITLSFLGGMLSVFLVLPIQKIIYTYVGGQNSLSFFLWASVEEIFKFLSVYFIALRKKKIVDEPIDDIIYLIISALGFVTLENTLFLIDPTQNGDFWGTIIHGNLRFIGASLLHIVSSATIGICMGLSFYKEKNIKRLYTISGILIAIVLHTSFNLFIISKSDGNIFFVFGLVWVCVIILLLLLEKIKHMKKIRNLDTQN